LGARIGVGMIRAPSTSDTASNGPENLVSRSWIRNRCTYLEFLEIPAHVPGLLRDPAESGLVVVPAMWILLVLSSMKNRT